MHMCACCLLVHSCSGSLPAYRMQFRINLAPTTESDSIAKSAMPKSTWDSLKALADVDWQQVEALGESALAHADRLLHSLIEHLPAAEKILWEIFDSVFGPKQQIGRASCRERVCQDV